MNIQLKRCIKAMCAVMFAVSSFTAFSDDTDIIDIEVPTGSNVLFVMDMSGSMSYRLSSDDLPTGTEKSRKEVLHDALKTVLNAPELATGDIRVGLSSFAGDPAVADLDQKGHGVSYPVTPLLDEADTRLKSNALWDHQSSVYDGETVTSYLPLAGLRTSKGYMGDAIPADWAPKGKTPIVDALYEAALYFRGSEVDFGKSDPSNVSSAHPSTYTGLIYNKTVMVDVPTLEVCGGATGITCNATVDSCPSTFAGYQYCNTSDPSCATTAESNGYVCGLPYTPTASNYNCDLASCSANASCDTSITNSLVSNHVCGLSSASACESANPSWDVGSCTARIVPEQPGACNSWDIEGSCNGYAPPTPESTVYDCTETTQVYTCSTIYEERQYCSKYEPRCSHTIQVPTPQTVPHGSATYKSPITAECPNNSIILLSDGKPTRNNSAAKIGTLIGDNSCNSIVGDDNDIDYAGRCGKELTGFLATQDNSSTVTGDQPITTHAIGLSLGTSSDGQAAETYLQNLASNGGGKFINASTPDGLVAALLNTIKSTAKARSFTSPTYTSNSFSMSHGDSVYVPVFDKSIGPVWSGNLKKYKRSGGRLIDVNSADATDQLGNIKALAQDFWSTVASNEVNSGGVANVLPAPDSRVLYTDAGMTSGAFGTARELKSTNTNVSKLLLGDALMSDAHRNSLIDFIRGKNSDSSARKHIGDIIHSKPIFVEYASSKRLFVGTNEGYLHAFDESTGIEQFAFMPSSLLKNIDPQYKNDAGTKHPYGVDGPITLQHDDANGDGIVNGTDKAVLYFGLRRGGKAYYALDVTNPASAPVLKWKVEQGTGDFSKLGYSWSQPVVMNMKHDKTSPAEQVVVFGGGYVDDNGGELDNSGTGADVFIVKASDGSLVWRLSDTSKTSLTNTGVNLEYAVPGNIRVMDISGNNALDRLYFGDTGGNVWRVDFESYLTGTSGTKKAKLKRFADLGGTAPKRKFFTEPDVAIFKANGGYRISVAIGSGQRPNPLDVTTDDHFFVMFDKDIRKAPVAATPSITKSILKDATSGPVTGAISATYKGWYMDLVELIGEKVLARATTYNNKIIFNSFGALSISSAVCGVSNVNHTRLYVVDLMTAGGVVDLNKDATTDPADPDDRSIKVAEGEIPGAPHIVLDESSTCVQGNCAINDSVGSGRGVDIPLSSSKVLRRVFWIDRE